MNSDPFASLGNAVLTPDNKKTKAKVKFDYNAQASNQISIKAGWEIEVTVAGPAGGWTKAKDIYGKEGYFPSDYAEIIKDEVKKAAPPPPPPVVMKAEPAKKQVKKLKCKALYAYKASGPNETTFAAGEIMDVDTRGPPGAWSRTTRGAFPTDYVEFFEVMVDEVVPAGGSFAGLTGVGMAAAAAPASTAAPVRRTSAFDMPSPEEVKAIPSIAAISTPAATQPAATATKPLASSTPAAGGAAARPDYSFSTTPAAVAGTGGSHHPPPMAAKPTHTAAVTQPAAPAQQTTTVKLRAEYKDTSAVVALSKDSGEYALSIPGHPASNPVWRSFLFMDMFADYNLDQIMSDTSSVRSTSLVGRMRNSFNLLQRALGYVPEEDHDSDDMKYVIGHAKKTFDDAVQLCDRIPFKCCDPNGFFVFLSAFMTRVNFLGGGDVLLCPVVFSTDNGEDSGLLVLLRRESVGTETDYSLSIVNTHGGAGGLDYHPMAADGTDGSLLRAMSFTLRGISNHKIKNSMFW